MKRLLAYLFIVLGLGLVVNNFALAQDIKTYSVYVCIEGNCDNGQGTQDYDQGKSKYVGEFKNGKRHGQGTFTWIDGSKYVGEFKKGKRHGQGTRTWSACYRPCGKNEKEYVGEFKGGLAHGQGTETYENGYKYVGGFFRGEWRGQGTLTLPDGYKYVGEFLYSNFHGQGTETSADGTIRKGIWRKGKLVVPN